MAPTWLRWRAPQLADSSLRGHSRPILGDPSPGWPGRTIWPIQSSSEGQGVQRYEYRELITNMAGEVTRVRYLDDREVPDWSKGPQTVEYLNRLSDEGWELVSVCMPGAGPWGARMYTLRRPLA